MENMGWEFTIQKHIRDNNKQQEKKLREVWSHRQCEGPIDVLEQQDIRVEKKLTSEIYKENNIKKKKKFSS